MTPTVELLDPTSETVPLRRERIVAPRSLDGLTVALLDIAKPRSDVFLDRIEQRLNAVGVASKRYRKPTQSRKAPRPILDAIVDECDLVVEALGD